MFLLAVAGFAISVLIALGEAYYERDWPRDTFKFVVMFGLVLIMFAAA